MGGLGARVSRFSSTPHELSELTKQVALDTETTGTRTAWHTLSIDLACGLFPETRIELRASVLVGLAPETLQARIVTDSTDNRSRGPLGILAALGQYQREVSLEAIVYGWEPQHVWLP